ncbi:MAG: hypothetical protein ACLTLQ_10835 [[Clostridium] scindens]
MLAGFHVWLATPPLILTTYDEQGTAHPSKQKTGVMPDVNEDKHIIWSNYDLDYEDWRGDLEAEYPELSRMSVSLMYEINGHYLDDERMNLNVQLSQPILVIGDLLMERTPHGIQGDSQRQYP